MSRATVILTNYRRPDNVPLVIDALRAQTERPEIMICDNGPEGTPWPKDMRVMRAPWNAGCFLRLFAAFYVETPWVIQIDDDLMPADQNLLADALMIAEARPYALTGAFGADIRFDPPYYRDDASGHVIAVKGRFIVYRKDLLSRVRLMNPIQERPEYRNRVDDLYLSFETGKMLPVHWADDSLAKRLTNLPEGPHALCANPEHVRIRDSFILDYYCQLTG